MVEKLLLQCGDCGTLLKSAEKAEEHAKENWHTNFRESNEEFVYLLCKVCGKQCVCKTESVIHSRKSGHTEFYDRTAEVAEEAARRNRANIRQMLRVAIDRLDEADTSEAARRQQQQQQQLGLPSRPVLQEGQSSLPLAAKVEQMAECLRTIQQNSMDDAAKVMQAFNSLRMFVRNIATNPDEEKYRKIRISNTAFQARVGHLRGGIEFLEVCGFERTTGGEHLYMQRENVDFDVLYSAANVLNNAIGNA
ncbi:UBX domain-containing protein 1-like isoform X2 [Solanum pennellii]|uniref:UBX domain-containing protein 1-like isoform X2 n=1 Tax=Solanum pennellii TaxID=28526 RepID=A0ABM1VHZ6_SOLPN|nr:UBX domain-containing protein 1-like isoform X2 [Solanum pennellii]